MQAWKWGSPEGRGGQYPALPMFLRALVTFAAFGLGAPALAGDPPSTMLEDLTWTEIAAAMEDGWTRAIVPTGGTEQNGPHMILGKHNYVVRDTAVTIARELGRTLVAPVIAHVPEGEAGRDPSGHMRWPGTITVSEDTFERLVADTVRSLATHGFNVIFLIGDSGGNQEVLADIAGWREWRRADIRVIHLDAYYEGHGQAETLAAEGYSEEETGGHASLRDTSELMAAHPEGVRATPLPVPADRHPGVAGDPSRASAEIGRRMLALKVEAALRQAREALGEAP